MSTAGASTMTSSCRRASTTSKRGFPNRSEEHTSELQSRLHLVCRLLLEKKKINNILRLCRAVYDSRVSYIIMRRQHCLKMFRIEANTRQRHDNVLPMH